MFCTVNTFYMFGKGTRNTFPIFFFRFSIALNAFIFYTYRHFFLLCLNTKFAESNPNLYNFFILMHMRRTRILKTPSTSRLHDRTRTYTIPFNPLTPTLKYNDLTLNTPLPPPKKTIAHEDEHFKSNERNSNLPRKSGPGSALLYYSNADF